MLSKQSSQLVHIDKMNRLKMLLEEHQAAPVSIQHTE